jgi:soluble lytic murein transglycosylase
MRTGAVVALAAMAIFAACGRAQEPAQSQQPATPVAWSPQPVAPSDVSLLRDGLQAAQFGDWSRLRVARSQAAEPIVRKILTWRLAAAQNSDAQFDEVDAALLQLASWPGRETMRRRGEQMIFDSQMGAEQRANWLSAEGGPLTGDGQVADAVALAQLGRRVEAVALARETWRERALTNRAEKILLANFEADLTAQDFADRVDRLLWRDDRSNATSLLSRLSTSDRAVANARLGLQGGKTTTRIVKRKGKNVRITVGPNVAALLAAVPVSRANDPGLLYDRARQLRRSGKPEEALAIVSRISPAEASPSVRETLFQEMRLYIPRALRMGQFQNAYNIASQHGLQKGEAFADGEWLAGWIALKFLRNPNQAAAHFAHLDDNVSTPVSKARALYWRAQADKALNQPDAANAALTQAAAFGFTYYGQLAAQALNQNATLSLGDPPPLTPQVRGEFEQRELVRALRLVAQIGDRQAFELISFYLDDQLETPAEHEMLADLARMNFYTRVAVRSAKSGIRRGIVAQEAAFPLIDLPPQARGSDRPEPALVLSIARQESEFDPNAVSPVGARGLMQIMPATARSTAKRYGFPYTPASLTSDPNYNLTLGSAYLGQLIDSFGGSYVLAIASYNAGPGRANEWIGQWGDPRSPSVDVVDWVELIPISETRNYVQRVLENLQVYRYRLNGGPTPLKIMQDLKRGG